MAAPSKKKDKVKKSIKRSKSATPDIVESQVLSNDPTKGPPFNPGGKNQVINTQVEVSKAVTDDLFQTNIRSKGSIY